MNEGPSVDLVRESRWPWFIPTFSAEVDGNMVGKVLGGSDTPVRSMDSGRSSSLGLAPR
jgi:hypothetical protein